MSNQQYLGIEIGGTKLQLGVGDAHSSELTELVRSDVVVEDGADGIVKQIETHARTLLRGNSIKRVGVGFGGPVDVRTGVVFKSHQIQGWDNFPLVDRLQDVIGLPVCVDNDCNVAALGEARLGAGQGSARVFYVTVGTGIGGGFVVDGELEGNQRPAISEIGHLRPGIDATSPEQTIESIASGWGIAAWTRKQLRGDSSGSNDADTKVLLEACGGNVEALTTKQIGAAAADGDVLSLEAIHRATRTLGWGIAQVVTLLAPEVIVVGGGVSLIGETFFSPLRQAAEQYSFGALQGSYSIVPAGLGEEVVLHGALQLAKSSAAQI